MTAETLRRGTCTTLPGAVVDKYFFARSDVHPFEFYTARLMCHRCPVRSACLTQAITNPAVLVPMIRGGESNYAIRNLRRRYVIHGEPVEELVAQVLLMQDSDREVGDFAYLRRGQFESAPLIGVAS